MFYLFSLNHKICIIHIFNKFSAIFFNKNNKLVDQNNFILLRFQISKYKKINKNILATSTTVSKQKNKLILFGNITKFQTYLQLSNLLRVWLGTSNIAKR